MEPGKILHELRAGELARTGELPHTPYYGWVDSTPLWLILLGETYDWTGDLDLVDRLWPNALAALEWIDRYGDRDGDGFVEYERRSERGLLNQGWKDSGDAIRDRTGAAARAPIALAEVQGYVFDAKRRMASLARVRGEPELAARLETEAEALPPASRRPSGSRTSATTRWRSTATSASSMRSLATPDIACGRASSRRNERATSSTGCSAVDVLRLGDSDVRLGAAGLQPDRLSHRDGLAARQLADRRRGSSATGSTTPRIDWPAR